MSDSNAATAYRVGYLVPSVLTFLVLIPTVAISAMALLGMRARRGLSNLKTEAGYEAIVNYGVVAIVVSVIGIGVALLAMFLSKRYIASGGALQPKAPKRTLIFAIASTVVAVAITLVGLISG